MKYKFRLDKLTSGLFALCILMFTSTLAFSEVIDLSPSQDTFVDSRKANNSYGSKSYIRLKESKRSDRRGLIKFDMNEIPDGSEIQSAKLSVFVTYKRSFNNILTVYEALGAWSESTKWSNKPSMSSLSEDSVSIGSGGVYYELDVTGIVQDWVDGVAQNDGLYLVISNGYVNINSRENSSYRPVLNVTYNSPESESEPRPVNAADSGVSDAPMTPVNKRILVVSQDGGGDYWSIQDALDDSRPGDTIQVKDGVYVEGVRFSNSGTRELPIALVNYPGQSPVVDPGGGAYPADDDSLMVQFRAEWIIFEGFEVRHGWNGIKVYKPHNTIRNNWIHDNRYQGMLIISTSDVYIEGNTIDNNGTAPGACYRSNLDAVSPRHCHGVYISDYSCTGASNITIRGNKISNHAGTGVGSRAEDCASKISNNLVENNIIENNSWGLTFNTNVDGNVIRNNTVVIEDYPETNSSTNNFIVMWESRNNVFMNNIFYSTREDVYGLQILDRVSTQNTFDYNLWHVKGQWLVWDNKWIKDFGANYQDVTGWGKNSWCCSVNPDFVSTSQKNYKIRSDSPAVDTGAGNECSKIDFEGQERIQGQGCDIGMDEYL